jgi:hypothetical protein
VIATEGLDKGAVANGPRSRVWDWERANTVCLVRPVRNGQRVADCFGTVETKDQTTEDDDEWASSEPCHNSTPLCLRR